VKDLPDNVKEFAVAFKALCIKHNVDVASDSEYHGIEIIDEDGHAYAEHLWLNDD
tara:strand:- start:279 stop:443 length:165 start_codon:yes stop_codon:yes gene_type:complete